MPQEKTHKVNYTRFQPELDERLKRAEKLLSISRAAVIRLAVERGLPILEEQLAPQTKPQP